MSEISMLPGWEAELTKLLKPRLESLSERMLEGANDDTPELTGYLREHNYSRVEEDGTIILGNDAEYADAVEHGHHIAPGDIPAKTASTGGFVEAQPFLRPQLFKNWGNL